MRTTPLDPLLGPCLLALAACSGSGSKAPLYDSTALPDSPGDSPEGDSEPDELAADCPSWLGLPGSTNRYSAYPDYLITAQELPSSTISYTVMGEHDASSDGVVAIYTDGAYRITSESAMVFNVADTTWFQCADGEAYMLGRDTRYYLNTFDGSPLEATVSVSYDPPVIIMPAVQEVGETWEIDSLETITLHTGDVRTTEVHEVRTIAAFETFTIPSGDELAMRIDSSTGQRWWYGDGIGLLGTDGVTLYGSSEPREDRPSPPGPTQVRP